MMTILFVCTGNLCRSPMAEGLLRKRLEDEGLDGRYRVRSAGIWAVEGRQASQHAIHVMAERGIDITDHIAHTLNADDVAEADLILIMAKEHAQMIRNTWPQYAWKVHYVSEMSGRRQDVRDPYGDPIGDYRACAETLSRHIDKGLGRILELA
jgi:protein-tyrosine phosphatase